MDVVLNVESCDSLSNLYLWHIKYSYPSYWTKNYKVVIRFQICIFDILNTAEAERLEDELRCDSLSNLYLWHIKYSSYCMECYENQSCDSLSNLYLWHIKYSVGQRFDLGTGVVIRFQICIFDILNTANTGNSVRKNGLWFAFKFVSLTY